MNVPHLSGPSTKAQILIFPGTNAPLESDYIAMSGKNSNLRNCICIPLCHNPRYLTVQKIYTVLRILCIMYDVLLFCGNWNGWGGRFLHRRDFNLIPSLWRHHQDTCFSSVMVNEYYLSLLWSTTTQVVMILSCIIWAATRSIWAKQAHYSIFSITFMFSCRLGSWIIIHNNLPWTFVSLQYI